MAEGLRGSWEFIGFRCSQLLVAVDAIVIYSKGGYGVVNMFVANETIVKYAGGRWSLRGET